VKRALLRSGSLRRPRWGRRGWRWRRSGRRRSRLATAYRTARGLQMHVIHEPPAAVRPHDVNGNDLIAIGALQFDAIRPQIIPSRHGHWSFDDAVTGMIEILLNDGETLAQYVAVHRGGGGTAFGSPELAHPSLIIGLHCGKKLRDRLVHRLRNRPRGTRLLAARGGSEQQEVQREPSLHEVTPRVRSNRR
jgi:hypothetical protein